MTIERLALFELLYKSEQNADHFASLEKRPENDWGQKFFYADAASRWAFVASLIRGVINDIGIMHEFKEWELDKDSLGSDIR